MKKKLLITGLFLLICGQARAEFCDFDRRQEIERLETKIDDLERKLKQERYEHDMFRIMIEETRREKDDNYLPARIKPSRNMIKFRGFGYDKNGNLITGKEYRKIR
ncbi:MAG: hypothetical protein FJ264_16915 [Planctomycetes bacterium]|nr:hypothetical protein [Planctomycetota bacterium]